MTVVYCEQNATRWVRWDYPDYPDGYTFTAYAVDKSGGQTPLTVDTVDPAVYTHDLSTRDSLTLNWVQIPTSFTGDKPSGAYPVVLKAAISTDVVVDSFTLMLTEENADDSQ